MKQLLSIEYSKLKKLNAIKIILLIYMIMVPLFMYVASGVLYNMLFPVLKIQQAAANKGVAWIAPKIWEFPEILKFTFYCASYFHILIGIILVIIVSNEFTNRTAKQNVIDGLTKKQLIYSKIIILFILALFITFYNTILAVIFGLINSSSIDLYTNSHYIFVFLFQSFCYFSLALFFVILIKHAAMSIVAFAVFPIVDFIVGKMIPNVFYSFFPLNIFSTLTPSPVRKEFISIEEAESKIKLIDLELWQLSGISSLYVLTFFVVISLVLKKRDL